MKLVPNKNIFQVFLSSDLDCALSNELTTCTQSINAHSGGLNHFILRNNQLESIIKDHMPPAVHEAYQMLAPFSYKADLGRYCLLYLFGGWYFDISVSITNSLPDVETITHIVFKDAPHPICQTWDTSTSVIYAAQGSEIMSNSINQIVENCRNKWYGVNALCPTGPGVLGRSIAIHGSDPLIMTGMLQTLTPSHYYKNNAFVLPDGTILAWGKKTWGTPQGNGLQALGAKGTDSYAELYNAKKIYNSI